MTKKLKRNIRAKVIMLFPVNDRSSRLILTFSCLTSMLSIIFIFWSDIRLTQGSLFSFATFLSSILFIRWLFGYAIHKKGSEFSVRKIGDIQSAIAVFDFLIVFTIYSHAVIILSYGGIYLAKPLVNTTLIEWDHMLGFDWLNLYYHHKHYSSIVFYLLLMIYNSLFIQLPLISIYLCITRRDARIKEYFLVFIFSSLMCIILAACFPADTTFDYYKLSKTFETTHFHLLRQRQFHSMDLNKLQPLISMPSFHAVSAICLSYAARGLSFFPVIVILNGVMLYATLLIGGHYLVDVLAGTTIAITSIVITRFIEKPRII